MPQDLGCHCGARRRMDGGDALGTAACRNRECRFSRSVVDTGRLRPCGAGNDRRRVPGSFRANPVNAALIRERNAGRELFDSAWTMEIARGGFVVVGFTLICQPAAAFFSEPRIVPVLLWQWPQFSS